MFCQLDCIHLKVCVTVRSLLRMHNAHVHSAGQVSNVYREAGKLTRNRVFNKIYCP